MLLIPLVLYTSPCNACINIIYNNICAVLTVQVTDTRPVQQIALGSSYVPPREVYYIASCILSTLSNLVMAGIQGLVRSTSGSHAVS